MYRFADNLSCMKLVEKLVIQKPLIKQIMSDLKQISMAFTR